MMGYGTSGMVGGAWLLMGLFWVALIALIIWLVIRLLPTRGESATPGPTHAQPESPLEILDRRLAAGEVDLETYKAHRSALLEARGGPR
ncbi:MAG: hypothetical protein HGA44_08390 [Cellulomonadaceae bacterium]|nr:hypothetical protein [Cellulomonadaceae bacterium]